ncbi:ricin-type beta-trefoil lectin domain protein [Streptomyces microflavus]|uniref:ricin-type beta-trefoil lectin domain protein n=1 Tax=Streptomyces microflavus TaxID=1919 RepID=UPI0036BB8A53
MRTLAKTLAVVSLTVFPLLASAAPAAAAEDLPGGVFQIKSELFGVCGKPSTKAQQYRITSAPCNSQDTGQRWTFDQTTRQVRNEDPAFKGMCLENQFGSWLVMANCLEDSLFGSKRQQWQRATVRGYRGDYPGLVADGGGTFAKTSDTGAFWLMGSVDGQTDPERNSAISFPAVTP